MKTPFVPVLLAFLNWIQSESLAAVTHQYLFIGHPRDVGPGDIVQRGVERVDSSAFDLLLLGGDYAFVGTGTRQTVAYLDAVLHLSSPSTLAALGNHDTSNKSYFTDVTGRPPFYSYVKNGITFVVLDTTDNGQNIVGAELQMLTDTINAIPANSPLVIVHHHIIWLSNYPPLAQFQGSLLIAASSRNLSGLNFYSVVYPLLLQARAKGVDVICLAGDRTGNPTTEFHIDHTTVDGVRFIAAGLMEDAPENLRPVVVLEQDVDAGTLTPQIRHLSDLPRIPDEPLIINEVHYDPSAAQGDDTAFIELYNSGDQPYDLSGATFWTGVVFTFPANTFVQPGQYVLVAANPAHYAGLGVPVFDYDGNAKPTSGAPIWLRDSRRVEIDYVAYGVSNPWPSTPSGQGPSLMLIDPRVDNTPATSWAPSDLLAGTPGRANIEMPLLESFVINGGVATLQWTGVVTDARYRLDFTPSLSPPDWQPAGVEAQATAPSIQLTDPNVAESDQRFFRLSRLFP